MLIGKLKNLVFLKSLIHLWLMWLNPLESVKHHMHLGMEFRAHLTLGSDWLEPWLGYANARLFVIHVLFLLPLLELISLSFFLKFLLFKLCIDHLSIWFNCYLIGSANIPALIISAFTSISDQLAQCISYYTCIDHQRLLQVKYRKAIQELSIKGV